MKLSRVKLVIRKFAGSILLSIISLCLICGVLEIIVRVLYGVPLPEKLPLVKVQPDPDLGWKMVPGGIHYTYQERVELNSLGFRGPGVAEKKEGEYRILALGDSHLYGQGISDEDLLTTQVQVGLNKKMTDYSFRVINMGTRAYSINQELALLEKTYLDLKPDHVIQFFYINDFGEVDIAARYEKFKKSDTYIYDLRGELSKEVLYKFRLRQILRKSAFLMWSHDLYRNWKSRGNLEEAILLGKSNEETEEGIDKVKNYLKRFHALSKHHEFSFTLAVIPASVQITNIYPENLYQSVLEQFSEKQGISYIDLLPSLRDYYQREGGPYLIPYDGHYNASGQKAMATPIIDHILLRFSQRLGLSQE